MESSNIAAKSDKIIVKKANNVANASQGGTRKLQQYKPLPVPQNILEEEEYTSALEGIIERDFFPELAKLRKDNDGFDYLEPQTEQGKNALELSLSEFQVTYTSADNASFQDILNAENLRRRQRNKWAWDEGNKLRTRRIVPFLESGGEVSLMEIGYGGLSKEKPKDIVDTRMENPLNTLMYDPELVRSIKDDAEPTIPKIVHTNTRFQPETLNEQIIEKSVASTSNHRSESIRKALNYSWPNLTPAENIDQIPRIRGYSFVDEISHNTTSFHLPGPSDREKIASALMDKHKKNREIKLAKAMSNRTPKFKSGDMNRLKLTPAGHRLLERSVEGSKTAMLGNMGSGASNLLLKTSSPNITPVNPFNDVLTPRKSKMNSSLK